MFSFFSLSIISGIGSSKSILLQLLLSIYNENWTNL
jgi:hypothetical protein